MRTVFSTGIAVCSEELSAIGTGEVINSLAVDFLRVRVPPGNTAFIAAELDALSAGCLSKKCAALQAEIGIHIDTAVVRSLCAGQSYFSTICNDSAFLQVHSLCDGGISEPM